MNCKQYDKWNLVTLDLNDTTIVLEKRNNDDITFSSAAIFDANDMLNGDYGYVVFDYNLLNSNAN